MPIWIFFEHQLPAKPALYILWMLTPASPHGVWVHPTPQSWLHGLSTSWLPSFSSGWPSWLSLSPCSPPKTPQTYVRPSPACIMWRRSLRNLAFTFQCTRVLVGRLNISQCCSDAGSSYSDLQDPKSGTVSLFIHSFIYFPKQGSSWALPSCQMGICQTFWWFF